MLVIIYWLWRHFLGAQVPSVGLSTFNPVSPILAAAGPRLRCGKAWSRRRQRVITDAVQFRSAADDDATRPRRRGCLRAVPTSRSPTPTYCLRAHFSRAARTALRPLPLDLPACSVHPLPPACGGILADDGPAVVLRQRTMLFRCRRRKSSRCSFVLSWPTTTSRSQQPSSITQSSASPVAGRVLWALNTPYRNAES